MTSESLKDLSVAPIFGIPVFIGTKETLLTKITNLVVENTKLQLIFTPNPEQISRSFHEPQFKQALQSCDLNLPDGAGLVWALGRKNGFKRISGREVFHDLLKLAEQNHWKVVLLGGKPGAAEKLQKKFKNQIFFESGDRMEAETRAIKLIKSEKPNLVFVAYGAPWQEYWILKHKQELESAQVNLAMVVGGAIDYEAGLVARVPKAFETLHLEWLWRLLQEPWRAKRQLMGLEFFVRVLFSQVHV